MTNNLMTLDERVAELETRLKACADSDLETIVEIHWEIIRLCRVIELKANPYNKENSG